MTALMSLAAAAGLALLSVLFIYASIECFCMLVPRRLGKAISVLAGSCCMAVGVVSGGLCAVALLSAIEAAAR